MVLGTEIMTADRHAAHTLHTLQVAVRTQLGEEVALRQDMEVQQHQRMKEIQKR